MRVGWKWGLLRTGEGLRSTDHQESPGSTVSHPRLSWTLNFFAILMSLPLTSVDRLDKSALCFFQFAFPVRSIPTANQHPSPRGIRSRAIHQTVVWAHEQGKITSEIRYPYTQILGRGILRPLDFSARPKYVYRLPRYRS